jgi:hypothetical protein
VYANPFQPEICPVLALAVHTFSYGLRVFNMLLFDSKADKYFGENLKALCKKIEKQLQDAGIRFDDIG